RPDVPVQVGHARKREPLALLGREPDGVPAVLAVAPHDIVVPVAVEVADSLDVPVHADRSKRHAAIPPPLAPADGGAARAVPPEDVGPAIAVEVAGARHPPIAICNGTQFPALAAIGTAPDDIGAGPPVAPYQVRAVVTIEIPCRHDFPIEVADGGDGV